MGRAAGSKLTPEQREKCGKGKGTLCWQCDFEDMRCSWMRELIPVDGWTADPTEIISSCTNPETGEIEITSRLPSYNVKACPLFKPHKKKEAGHKQHN
ncbi:MAG: hypothetical protein LIO40_06160 [Ruminococcus sp.]|nr:hypothetical protein [Ruminococcus sp.]